MNSTYSVLNTKRHSKRLLTEASLLMVITIILQGSVCASGSPRVDHPLQYVKPEARDTQVHTHLLQDRKRKCKGQAEPESETRSKILQISGDIPSTPWRDSRQVYLIWSPNLQTKEQKTSNTKENMPISNQRKWDMPKRVRQESILN